MRCTWTPTATFLAMILVHIATVHASAQVHLPLTHTAVDRTSFIVKFDEALIAPVSISAVDSSDDDTEAVRAAAQQLADAAATAAARIAELARQAGIDMQVVDTYGERSATAGIIHLFLNQLFIHLFFLMALNKTCSSCSCLLCHMHLLFSCACRRPCDDWHGSEGGNSRGRPPPGSAAQG